MVLLAGGAFTMGSDDFYPDERPAHEASVDAFWIDTHQVTNAEFAGFVEATGYVTVAERALDPVDFPDVALEDLVPGSMVFTPTAGPVDLRDWRQWWRWEPGAQWRHPEGAATTIAQRMDHPVVHVAFDDASAYAAWAGKRLPSEAEFEYAARGGERAGAYAWGDEAYPGGVPQANSWIGSFPYDDRGAHGGSTAAVGTYRPNGFGLYDTIGNVWEWTTDYYLPRHRPPGADPVDREHRQDLLAAASAEPGSRMPRRVLKGGSYLCSPDYCLRFRPAARSPQADDSAATHIGFRCARGA